MKNLLPLFVSIFSLLSCQTKKNQLENTTWLGAEYKNNEYIIIDRCDGGYPLLKFYKNEFYFYAPQEGAYYKIGNISTNSKKYTFVTDQYKSLKQDIYSKRAIEWSLIKVDNDFWEFSNNVNSLKFKIIDSLLLSKNKIKIYHQPCTDCYDKELCDEWKKKSNLKSVIRKSLKISCSFDEKNYEINVLHNNNNYKYENLEFTGFHFSKIYCKNNRVFSEFEQDAGGNVLCEYLFKDEDNSLYLKKITYTVLDKNNPKNGKKIFSKILNKKIVDIDGDDLLEEIQSRN